MDIFVCIKQVPSTNKVQVDEKTGVLKRSGIQSKMNPYDLYALETALRLKARYGGTVTVGTMGPPQAQAIIREAYMMGADDGYVFSDRRLGGADVLATSYTLSQAIQSVGDFDLILCGKQTTDGDTAQVGAEVAEYLGLPNVSNVRAIGALEEGKLTVTAGLDDRVMELRIALPCLLSMDGDINTPRLPSYKIRKQLTEEQVRMLSFADFADQDAGHYGLSGSATQVERIFPPEKTGGRQTLDGDAGTQAQALLALLRQKKFV